MGEVSHSLQSHLLECSKNMHFSGDRPKVMQLGTKSVNHPHRTRDSESFSESSSSEMVFGTIVAGIIPLVQEHIVQCSC